MSRWIGLMSLCINLSTIWADFIHRRPLMTIDRPLVFDIKRYALADGPGIRSTVFLKGCPLHCLWCQNPESIDPDPEIGFYPQDCIKCGDCVSACPVSACRLETPFLIDRVKCTRCSACVEVCPGRGLRRIGRFYSLDELISILLRDRVFYEVSGGGVTLSGGEPTFFMDYAAGILRALKNRHIHTAIQTNGFFVWDEFKDKILPNVNLIMFDVKMADADKHLEYTGQRNELILANLKNILAEKGIDVLPRIPLIPGFTATEENLRSLSCMFKELRVKKCSLVPYNPTWISKAENMGKKIDPRLSGHALTPEELEEKRGIFSWARLITF